VHEQVRLREEHVDIERRPVNERVDDPDRLFDEKSFEVSETSEEAVIGKTARMTEELVVRKDVGERVEQTTTPCPGRRSMSTVSMVIVTVAESVAAFAASEPFVSRHASRHERRRVIPLPNWGASDWLRRPLFSLERGHHE